MRARWRERGAVALLAVAAERGSTSRGGTVGARSYIRPTNEPASAAPGAEGGALALGRENHFEVILRLLLKKLSAPWPVMSQSPKLESVPGRPPNENGSRGTGTPMLTPIMPARKREANHSACPPFSV